MDWIILSGKVTLKDKGMEEILQPRKIEGEKRASSYRVTIDYLKREGALSDVT